MIECRANSEVRIQRRDQSLHLSRCKPQACRQGDFQRGAGSRRYHRLKFKPLFPTGDGDHHRCIRRMKRHLQQIAANIVLVIEL